MNIKLMKLAHFLMAASLMTLISHIESCGTHDSWLEDPRKPSTGGTDSQSPSGDRTDDENDWFNSQSTVADVTGDPAFALIYRPDDPYSDLARAITFICGNAESLGVARENYSLWGGSAGARMAAVLGNSVNLRELTQDAGLPRAAAVIMQYTGYSTVSEFDSTTYSCVGTDDGIASWRVMQSRLQRLEALGIPTEFHVYEGLGHGFGIGTGTVAEGWVGDAIDFRYSHFHHRLSLLYVFSPVHLLTDFTHRSTCFCE